jgi:hypothetical protein
METHASASDILRSVFNTGEVERLAFTFLYIINFLDKSKKIDYNTIIHINKAFEQKSVTPFGISESCWLVQNSIAKFGEFLLRAVG